MSNKNMDQLWEVDRLVRSSFATGMEEGTKIKIKFITGFELFNTRPYHNYETWSDGWVVEGLGVRTRAEDLDDAMREFIDIHRQLREGKQWEKDIPKWYYHAESDPDRKDNVSSEYRRIS